jgi:hypothetical protein
MLDKVSVPPYGLIEVRGPSERDELLTELCRALPESRIAVVVANRREVRRFCRLLQEPLAVPVYDAHSKDRWRIPSVTVVTSDLSASCRDDDFDVMIFADSRAAMSQAAYEGASRRFRAASYGFICRGERFGRPDWLRLHSVCGEVVHRTTRSLPADVTVVFLSFRHTRQPLGKSPLDRKKECFWHNPDRNKCVVDLARAIQSKNRRWLAKLPCWQTLVSTSPLAERKTYSVAILVESPEHARELQKALPDWDVLISENGTTAGWPNDQPLHQVIFTERAAQSLPLVDTDVLIRATGGRTPFPVREAGHDGEAPEAMVILDITDEGIDHVRSDTCQRRADYARHDWHVL